MTISRTVYNQLFEHSDAAAEHVIRLRPTEAKAGAVVVSAKNKIQMWTQEEHERFLVALEMFPAGPWKKVADYIGTKTPRQTMTHAQKYRQKISRRQRGLRNQKKNSSAPNSPKHLDTQSDYKHAPMPVHSPYGVADVYVKSEAKMYPQADMNSSGRLDMLARAMQMQSEAKPSSHGYYGQQQPAQPQQVEMTAQEGSFIMPSRGVPTAPVTSAAASSPGNSSLPSLAQILNLRGAPQAPQPQGATRAGCNCNCSCSPSSKGQDNCRESPLK
ncbi:Myb-like dna-binding protein, partial [Globisporangium splendens]